MAMVGPALPYAFSLLPSALGGPLDERLRQRWTTLNR